MGIIALPRAHFGGADTADGRVDIISFSLCHSSPPLILPFLLFTCFFSLPFNFASLLYIFFLSLSHFPMHKKLFFIRDSLLFSSKSRERTNRRRVLSFRRRDGHLLLNFFLSGSPLKRQKRFRASSGRHKNTHPLPQESLQPSHLSATSLFQTSSSADQLRRPVCLVSQPGAPTDE